MSCKNTTSRSYATLAGILLALTLSACEAPPPEAVVWVRIPPGDSLGAVAESLAVHGIVKSARSFERLARMGKKHLGIKPGVYPFRLGTPAGAVLVELRRGRPDAVRTRVVDGIWLSELLPALSRDLDIPMQDFWEAAGDSALRSQIGTGAETVEGYLYPTVYYVPVQSSALGVLRQMVDTFEAHWDRDWDTRLDTLGLTRAETVALASIIEGEAPQDADRSLVSSVYHNRLTRGLRLQADPTVVYALGRRKRLYNVDYRVESEYNTYRVSGIPRGPICQPSTASIVAALYPATTDYFYFVAVASGRHLFSRTYTEHLATIRRIRSGGPNASLER
jgi:UPF0755 protein